MERKVNQIGPSTLMVSLPSKWVKKYNIKKGDVLEVEENKEHLILRQSGKPTEGTRLVLDLNDLNVSLIWYYITAAYRSGAEEIHLNFSPTVKDDKLNKTVEIHTILQNIIDRCIGMEIIRNTPSSYTVKEISSIKQDELATIFRRIFFSLQVMFDDIIEGIEKKDNKIIDHVAKYADIQVNKFSDYCIRILTKTQSETQMINIITRLEEIGDSLKHLANHILSKPLTEEILGLLKEEKQFFAAVEKFYFHDTKEELLNMEKQKIAILKKIEKMQKFADIGAFIIIIKTGSQILSLIETKLTMSFLQRVTTKSSS